jgi:hypothetical protein
MKTIRFPLALVSIIALGACGTTTSDRALSGGAIGAGAGALGALSSEPPWPVLLSAVLPVQPAGR